jgi:hypothetical protein
MLYQWQLVKNKVIQSNFPGNFHDKISLRISLLQEELKNFVIYKYRRLLDVVPCELKKKMFKERRPCGSNEGPVNFLSTWDLLSC